MDLGLPFAVVTGSSRSNIYENLVSDFGSDLMRAKVVCGVDVAVGKPSPVPFVVGAHKLRVDPKSTITIENAPLGVYSATTAGSFVVGVNTGILGDSVLIQAGARQVFGSCSELAKSMSRIVGEIQEGASAASV